MSTIVIPIYLPQAMQSYWSWYVGMAFILLAVRAFKFILDVIGVS